MCRNIRTLYNFEPPATDDEVQAAALQYVRKISGFTKPSKANEEAFQRAIEDVAAISARLLGELETNAPPKDGEVEAAKAKGRAGEGDAGAWRPGGFSAAARPESRLRPRSSRWARRPRARARQASWTSSTSSRSI